MEIVEKFVSEKSRKERKSMLKLDEPCHERGLKYSTQLIALVAYHYNTTLPENGNKVVVCHGCNNDKCSNPNHMYWGSKGDNKLDDYESGKQAKKSPFHYLVEKYGDERAKDLHKEYSSKGGKNNQGVPKSEEHRQKLKKNKI